MECDLIGCHCNGSGRCKVEDPSANTSREHLCPLLLVTLNKRLRSGARAITPMHVERIRLTAKPRARFRSEGKWGVPVNPESYADGPPGTRAGEDPSPQNAVFLELPKAECPTRKKKWLVVDTADPTTKYVHCMCATHM